MEVEKLEKTHLVDKQKKEKKNEKAGKRIQDLEKLAASLQVKEKENPTLLRIL